MRVHSTLDLLDFTEAWNLAPIILNRLRDTMLLGRKVESMISIVYFLFVAVCIDLVAISSILILYSILYSVYVYCLSRDTFVNEEALELIDIETE